MSLQDIIKTLNDNNIKVIKETRARDGRSTRYDLNTGGIVNVYDTGTVTPQGSGADLLRKILPKKISVDASAMTSGSPGGGVVGIMNKVFVAYGHDEDSRNQLEAMLRRWNLEPQILDQLPSEGQTIIEKLEKYTNNVNFAVILATPDDEGYRSGKPDEKSYRARQNVVLELGMMLSTLGRSKVAILLKQTEKMERPSDIQGLIYLPFKDNIQKECGLLLAKEMVSQGYSIDISRI